MRYRVKAEFVVRVEMDVEGDFPTPGAAARRASMEFFPDPADVKLSQSDIARWIVVELADGWEVGERMVFDPYFRAVVE